MKRIIFAGLLLSVLAQPAGAGYREGLEAYSRLDYDAGSGAVALSIFAPVLDPSTGENIGVARASLRRRVGATK